MLGGVDKICPVWPRLGLMNEMSIVFLSYFIVFGELFCLQYRFLSYLFTNHSKLRPDLSLESISKNYPRVTIKPRAFYGSEIMYRTSKKWVFPGVPKS